MARVMLSDSRDIIRRLEETGRVVILPHPRRDIPIGRVRSIYRQAGWLNHDDR